MGILQGLFKAVIKNGDKVHNDKTKVKNAHLKCMVSVWYNLNNH